MSNNNEFDDPKGADLLGSIGPKAAFFIVLIALSFMIGVVWKLYVGGGDASNNNAPVIRADTTPYKVAPEEPGGMAMPNKDSTIFSSLNSDPDKERGVENLLAETTVEEPMSRTELFAGLNTEPSPDLHAEAQETPLDRPLSDDEARIVDEAKQAEAIVTSLVEDGADAIVAGDVEPAQDIAEVLENATPDALSEVPAKVEIKEPEAALQAVDDAEQKAAEAKAKAIAQAKEKAEAMEQAAAEAAAKSKADALAKIEADRKKVAAAEAKKVQAAKQAAQNVTPQAKILANGASYVQLASIKSRDASVAEWTKLNAKYGSLLSGYKYRVETADLGAKGTFYRIQAGPVSKAQAQKTCAAIKRKDPNGCLVK